MSITNRNPIESIIRHCESLESRAETIERRIRTGNKFLKKAIKIAAIVAAISVAGNFCYGQLQNYRQEQIREYYKRAETIDKTIEEGNYYKAINESNRLSKDIRESWAGNYENALEKAREIRERALTKAKEYEKKRLPEILVEFSRAKEMLRNDLYAKARKTIGEIKRKLSRGVSEKYKALLKELELWEKNELNKQEKSYNMLIADARAAIESYSSALQSENYFDIKTAIEKSQELIEKLGKRNTIEAMELLNETKSYNERLSSILEEARELYDAAFFQRIEFYKQALSDAELYAKKTSLDYRKQENYEAIKRIIRLHRECRKDYKKAASLSLAKAKEAAEELLEISNCLGSELKKIASDFRQYSKRSYNKIIGNIEAGNYRKARKGKKELYQLLARYKQSGLFSY